MSIQIKLRAGALSSYTKAKGISREEAARRMGVSSTTAFRVEKGEVAPGAKFIAAFIRVTGRPFEDLFEIVTDDEQVPA